MPAARTVLCVWLVVGVACDRRFDPAAAPSTLTRNASHDNASLVSVRFSPTAPLVAGVDATGVRMWKVDGSQVQDEWAIELAGAVAVEFAAGDVIYAAGAKVWTGRPGVALKRSGGAPVTCLAGASTGMVVVGAGDGGVEVFPTAASDPQVLYLPYNNPVTALAVSTDGAWLAAAGSAPAKVYILSLQDNKGSWAWTDLRAPDDAPFRSVAFAPDASVVAAAGGARVHILPIRGDAPPASIAAVAEEVAFAHDGTAMLCAGPDGVAAWTAGSERKRIQNLTESPGMSVTTMGSNVAASVGSGVLVFGDLGQDECSECDSTSCAKDVCAASGRVCQDSERAARAFVCVKVDSSTSGLRIETRHQIEEGVKFFEFEAFTRSTAASVGMLGIVRDLACNMKDTEAAFADKLDFEHHPLGIGVGSGGHRFLMGACFGNSLLIVAFIAVLLVVERVLERRGYTEGVLRDLIRAPGVVYVPYLFVLQGTTIAATRLLFFPEVVGAGAALFGGLTLAWLLAVPVLLQRYVLRHVETHTILLDDPFLRAEVTEEERMDDRVDWAARDAIARRYTGWKRKLYRVAYGDKLWLTKDHSFFWERYGTIFDSLRLEHHWMIQVQQVSLFVLAVLAACQPRDLTQCTLRNTTMTVICLIYFVLLVYHRPFFALMDNVVTGMIWAVVLTSIGLLTFEIGLETSRNNVGLTVASALLIFAAGLVFFKAVWDVVLMGASWVLRRRQTLKDLLQDEQEALFRGQSERVAVTKEEKFPHFRKNQPATLTAILKQPKSPASPMATVDESWGSPLLPPGASVSPRKKAVRMSWREAEPADIHDTDTEGSTTGSSAGQATTNSTLGATLLQSVRIGAASKTSVLTIGKEPSVHSLRTDRSRPLVNVGDALPSLLMPQLQVPGPPPFKLAQPPTCILSTGQESNRQSKSLPPRVASEDDALLGDLLNGAVVTSPTAQRMTVHSLCSMNPASSPLSISRSSVLVRPALPPRPRQPPPSHMSVSVFTSPTDKDEATEV